MRPDRTGDRQHSMVDLFILFAAIILALTTWTCLSGTAGIPVWKSYASVTMTLLLALAALTRNPNWAAAMRVLTGLWLIAAPYLLRFHDVTQALWTYLAVGGVVTALAIRGFTAGQNAREPVTV